MSAVYDACSDNVARACCLQGLVASMTASRVCRLRRWQARLGGQPGGEGGEATVMDQSCDAVLPHAASCCRDLRRQDGGGAVAVLGAAAAGHAAGTGAAQGADMTKH